MTVAQSHKSPSSEAMSHAASTHSSVGRVAAVLRIAFGLTFLWAFADKLLALGFSTGRADDGTVDRLGDAAWINGGSPTEGFLKFGADGPFDSFYHSIAGAAWADCALHDRPAGDRRRPDDGGFAMRIAAVSERFST